MWQPEPEWLALPGGLGPSTVGVWRTAHGDHPVVVKRLAAPGGDDPVELADPQHPAYWRREADVALTGLVLNTPGLRGVPTAVEEDRTGVTLTREWIEDAALSGLFAAHGLGGFAGAELPRTRFLTDGLLRARLARTERLSGGWPTLARTTVADVAHALWERRHHFCDQLDALAQVPTHGDPASSNLVGRSADDVVALDWSSIGYGPVGSDLGLYAVAARESFEPLLDAYLMGLPAHLGIDADGVRLGATVTAVYTALGRAEWALARVAGGEGALAGKFRHPAVAPHLRALQRLHPQVEDLVENR